MDLQFRRKVPFGPNQPRASGTSVTTALVRSRAMASRVRGPYLHRPEVEGQEEEHGDEAAHKASAEPVAAHIGDNGTHPEKQVEKGGQRVPREEPRSPLTAKAKRASTGLTVWVLTPHALPRALQAPLHQAAGLRTSAN